MILNDIDVLQNGGTALGQAIHWKHHDCVEMLVAAGADVLTSQVVFPVRTYLLVIECMLGFLIFCTERTVANWICDERV